MTGRFDPRNSLNDLTGKEWLLLTKSYWVSQKSAADKFAFKHPAPFLVKDIERLISMFTKKGMTVLDPFCGVGTTLVAAHNLGRHGLGIELNSDYVELISKRFVDSAIDETPQVILGDSVVEVSKIPHQIDYCVTSPPYHNILKNKGAGLRVKKEAHRSGSRHGVEYYSEEPNDLGNQDSYADFLGLLSLVMKGVFGVLKAGGYASIVISDFTVDKVEINVQGDIVKMMLEAGFEFSGTTILLQDNKPLYPFGYPYAYKINHHHQNIITFRKPKAVI